jgi:transglutaminase-like putative cysteine protease/Tfp pilus assembly protein PilF
MFAQKQLDSKCAFGTALALRSAAILGILFQFNLLAGELSDASVFIATILCAILAGFALVLKPGKPVGMGGALVILAAIPWFARFFIALPRYFAGTNVDLIIPLDTLLLNYDKNNFTALAPFYYAAITSFFAARKQNALHRIVFIDFILIIVTFSIAKSIDIAIYGLPLVRIAVFGSFIFLELAALILSVPKELSVTIKEKALSFALLVFLVLTGGAILLYLTQQPSSTSTGGGGEGNGMMQAKVFNFDMTPFLKLQSEINLNDELVFIVQRGNVDDPDARAEERYIYMRRFILSKYTSNAADGGTEGFTRSDTIDEINQRSMLPSGELSLRHGNYRKREELEQTYYLVNIDGAALLAMNEPEKVTPFENYDSSSFKSVYRTDSLVSTINGWDLDQIAEDYKNNIYLGLSEEEFNWYTDFANAKQGMTETERRITELSENLTVSDENYFEKVRDILLYLANGDYRYSLRPGIAPDGDQLAHFLFESKKGYCSYFAFAFASMLRSIKIPSRVVVGFYLDPETEKFGFYPVLSSMAHAWVEVWFPEYGWIEFDPTTDRMAAGEEAPSGMQIAPDLFEKLMKEILDNHNKLKAKAPVSDENEDAFSSLVKKTMSAVKTFSIPVLLLIIIIIRIISCVRFRLLAAFSKDPRRRTIYLWKDIIFRLKLKGYKKAGNEPEGEWINSLGLAEGETIVSLYDNTEQAKFAQVYTADDHQKFIVLYKIFAKHYSLFKKLKQKAPALAVIFFITFLFIGDTISGQTTDQTTDQTVENDADALYLEARRTIEAEYWERAIDLLNRGKELFPDDYRFPMRLASIYFSREFYNLSKEEWLIVNKLIPGDMYVIDNLARVTSMLNEYHDAAMYYEQLLELDRGNKNSISELAWMYFKLHKLEEAEQLLLSSVSEFGSSARFSMTLAIIYSEMLDYESSRHWYLDSISNAENSYFTALAYYNFSILEGRFYNHEQCFELAESSLRMADRDSGHMAKGELFFHRLDFPRTFAEYELAYEMDKQSPLPKISLSQTFLTAGRLEEARLYAEDCEKITNHSWMVNFGIDPFQFKKELNQILYLSYLGLYNKEKLTARGNIKEWYQGLVNKIKYKFKSEVYKILYRKYSLQTAGTYDINTMGSQYLDALLNYYYAFNDYPGRALSYLNKAQDYELEIIPKAAGSYLFENGKLFADKELLEAALSFWDSDWERDMMADTSVELYRIAKKQNNNGMAYTIAESLYMLNHGALRQAFIKLPVLFDISGGSNSINKKIAAALSKTGFEAVSKKAAIQNRWTLAVTVREEGEAHIELIDRTNGSTLVRRTFSLEDFSAASLAAFANNAADAVFNVR